MAPWRAGAGMLRLVRQLLGREHGQRRGAAAGTGLTKSSQNALNVGLGLSICHGGCGAVARPSRRFG